MESKTENTEPTAGAAGENEAMAELQRRADEQTAAQSPAASTEPPKESASVADLRELIPDVADNFLPGLRLAPAEVERLAKTGGRLIDKYFPDDGVGGLLRWLDGWKEELTFGWAVYCVFAPRVRAARAAHEAERKTTAGSTEKPAAPSAEGAASAEQKAA